VASDDFESGIIATKRDEDRRAYALELAINQASGENHKLPTAAETIERAAVFESFLMGEHHRKPPTIH
jgi:hypothetical protein